jgi:hypothetical protein
MGRIDWPLAGNSRDREGCAYLLTSAQEGSPPQCCGAARQPRSPYCPRHHALCHVPRGSRAERARLREVKALAKMVGGRRGRDDVEPSQRFLDRLEEAVREFL